MRMSNQPSQYNALDISSAFVALGIVAKYSFGTRMKVTEGMDLGAIKASKQVWVYQTPPESAIVMVL